MSPVRNIKFTRRTKISNGVRIIIKNLQKKIPINPIRIKKAALKTLVSDGIKKSGEITFCFVTDKKIKELNSKYLGKNNPTDVICFDITEKYIDANSLLADIVISTDRAIYNAKAFKTAPIYELYLYVVHGLLHLLGYDDKNISQKRKMQDKAAGILSALNIKPTK